MNKEKNNITSLAIKNFNFIFNNPIESNIKFIIDNKIIYAHRIILIAHSKYFKCLFSNKYNDYKNTDIIINNYKYDIFFNFIKYFYIGYIDLSNFKINEIFELLILADYYDIDNLKEFINKELFDIMSIKNVFSIFEYVNKLQLNNLLKKTILFIIENKSFFEEKDIKNKLNIDTSFLLVFNKKNKKYFLLHKQILDDIKNKV